MSHDDELGQAVDAYLEADAAARAAGYASQEYIDAAEARRKADRRLVKLLKYRGTAYTRAGSRWAVSPEGDLFKVADESRVGKSKQKLPAYRHFNNRTVRSES